MSHNTEQSFYTRVVAVQDDMVEIELTEQGRKANQRLTKNEVIYILPSRLDEKQQQQKLKAEVLRVKGNRADAQVYESTQGVAVGDGIEQSDRMLSVELGPGLLGQVYGGLQTPLPEVANQCGIFLPKGKQVDALAKDKKWSFIPKVKSGDKVKAGDSIGHVAEGRIQHKIMVPFNWPNEYEVVWITQGNFTLQDTVAKLQDKHDKQHPVTLSQRWPIRRPLNRKLLKSGLCERQFPNEPMVTTQRLIDTFFPIARGGTACIPGPFGAGKTVLQNLISRHSSVDIVVVVACGERAGEVVETINEFPQMTDPLTGGTLMDRTVIICNTSSMPVAAREASIYTGVSIGEYYQQMGFDVLLIADSTSRWAQAMRETSGRLEEIPGEEGFPAYLESAIKGVYERAGLVRTNDSSLGSLTIIGTVSPAGGNFDEPVTQSTLSTVKCFLGLSADRAYKRFYPAVDPLLSWSRYSDQLSEWFEAHQQPGWVKNVNNTKLLLDKGESILRMMQVTGEEGVTLEDFIDYQKALFVDMVYLQQDAFDDVDASNSLNRQKASFNLLVSFLEKQYEFETREQARAFFTQLTGLFKNLNYTVQDTPEYSRLLTEINQLKGH